MQLFVKRYVATLAILFAALGVYSLCVVPIVEPAGREAHAIPDYRSTVVTDRWWQEFFPAESWQTQTPRLFQSTRGILLAETWEQVDAQTLKLRPLTIIIPQSSRDLENIRSAESPELSQASVWIVSAQEAVIQFEAPFNAGSGGRIPSVASGKLSGTTHITRKTLGDSSGRAWTLQTSELFIERSRVYTDESVTISWDDSIISGRDLRIQMKGDLFSASSESKSSWGPLDTMELYTIERVDIGLPPGGLWAGMELPGSGLLPEHRKLPARLQLHSGGRFGFDFRRSTATLTNGVQVVQLLGSLFRDEFLCQQLSVELEPPPRASAASAVPQESLGVGSFQVVRLEASGIDQLENSVGERRVELVGEKRVELRAASIGAFASAKRLDIDFQAQRVEFDGKLNMPGATQSSAWLKFAGYEIRAPRIDYDANGRETTAKVEHLGFLVADGPGELQVHDADGVGSTQVRWQDSLQMRPSENPREQWVGIFGNTLVENAQHGFLASDKIEVWLRENLQPNPSATPQSTAGAAVAGAAVAGAAVAGAASDARATSDALGAARYQPDHLRASGRVSIETSSLHAKVNDLQLAIVYAPSTAADPLAATTSEEVALTDSAGNAMYQWVSPPGNTAPQSDLGSTAGQPAAREPVAIHGQELTSRIVVSGKESWIDDLQLSGPLSLFNQATAHSQSPAWRVEGQHLGLVTNRAGQVNMHVDGQPARVVLADGFLEGPSIRFDQQLNLLWMDHPGAFTAPTEPLGKQAAKPAHGPASLQWLSAPHCTWQGGMYFDGSVVHIKGAIEFEATLRSELENNWWIKGHSEELHIFLAAPIELQSESQAEATVDRFELSQDVNILALQFDNLGNRKSRQHIQVPRLTYHAIRNQVVGQGPGSLHAWQLLKGGLGQMAGMGSGTAPQWHAAHLVFRDSLVAFMDRNELVFEGKVELAAGPVASLEQSIDLYRMNQLSIGQSLLACDQLSAYDTSSLSSTAGLATGHPNQGFWNFHARGNVAFQGKTDTGDYRGNGSELSYVQAKEELRLKGDVRRDAVIVGVPLNDPQGKTITASVEEAVINPRTREVNFVKMGARGIKMEQPDSTAAAATPGVDSTQPLAPDSSNTQPRSAVRGFFQGSGR